MLYSEEVNQQFFVIILRKSICRNYVYTKKVILFISLKNRMLYFVGRLFN